MTGSSTIEVSHLDTRLPSPTLPIVLRTIQPSDAARLAALLSDPGNASDPNAAPLSATTASELIARQRLSASVPTVVDTARGAVIISGPSRVNMVIELLPDTASSSSSSPPPLVIGLGGYGAIKELVRDGKTIRAGDVGAMIDPEYRGKGYATEAMRLAIDWAFAEATGGGGGLQLDLVTVTTLEDNVAMVKLAEDRLGLKGRGTRRACGEEGAEGKTEVYYELTKEDW
ncbi:Acyl-CoA N-acyltransferase [Beauveria bassiana ARSEF 2860]|uniref:Acyl-CoA N-acyltransferase n=1 Tax=Beauveria bassiana (strain ARSEF 2860) TaxID=655819 RepID=J4UM09_BEAB2|nr:Acyl-CoA N-acyltransferase [Beauveria bassiana ARSEF 2860]EJP65737.1 Acyl-CoA N-acyltransferase [Beauveria bassiana ARSEF 2860]